MGSATDELPPRWYLEHPTSNTVPRDEVIEVYLRAPYDVEVIRHWVRWAESLGRIPSTRNFPFGIAHMPSDTVLLLDLQNLCADLNIYELEALVQMKLEENNRLQPRSAAIENLTDLHLRDNCRFHPFHDRMFLSQPVYYEWEEVKPPEVEPSIPGINDREKMAMAIVGRGEQDPRTATTIFQQATGLTPYPPGADNETLQRKREFWAEYEVQRARRKRQTDDASLDEDDVYQKAHDLDMPLDDPTLSKRQLEETDALGAARTPARETTHPPDTDATHLEQEAP